MKRITTLFFLIFCVFISQAQVVSEYDFNSINEGDLNGQDDWNTILNTTGPSDFIIAYAMGDVTSPDGSLAPFYNASGPGYGRAATRKASSNFDFNVNEADIVEIEIDLHKNYWGMFFGVGFDADGDGHIVPGLDGEENDGGIHFQIGNANPDASHKIVLPNGDEVNYTPTSSGWARYKMVLDFTANDGEGAVALFYDPDFAGDWIAITEVQGLNMGLTEGSGDKLDRTVWDGVFFSGSGGTAGYDNILVRETVSQGQSQYIDFAAIDNMLTTNPSFELNATATSGLPVVYAIENGPATIDGAVVTLTGDAGIVTISANQGGDATWAPAAEVSQSFEVVEATDYVPELTIRRPIEGPMVYMSELSTVLVVASAYIEHPEVLNIENVTYTINGISETMTEKSWGTGYYSAEWTPTDFDDFTMTITAESTGGMSSTSTVMFTVTNDVADMNVQTFDQVQIATSTSTTVIDEFEFPTYVGSFDEIMTFLDVTCPSGGCDPWDRNGSMYAKGPDGEWVEIIRYITPYGVPCDHSIEVTDYSSIFQGLVEMRFSIGTDAQGFVVDVNFDFQAGTPDYKYSWVNKMWDETYPFGDYDNLQPVEVISHDYESIAQASKLKIFNTGHGWGSSNSGNAAEFYESTHHIKVNDDSFDQHLWVQCNPNPDGCQPQNGTWYHNRAGWCPGSIGHMYEYDLTPYVDQADVEIQYEFYDGYVDYCHPNHPNCESGVTCTDCNEGFNPHYIISGYLVSYGDYLYIPTEIQEQNYFGLQMSPNPARYSVLLSSNKTNHYIDAKVEVMTVGGQIVDEFSWEGENVYMNVADYSEGVYLVVIKSATHQEVQRLVVE